MNLPTPFHSALVWFRRDLRDYDHAAFSAALRNARQVFCAFIFDSEILGSLPHRSDRRIQFIHSSLIELDASLRARGGSLIVRIGNPVMEIPQLANQLGVQAVFANRDYEPGAKWRDHRVAQALATRQISFTLSKDQALFDGDEVLTAQNTPFSVFTPYANAWLRNLERDGIVFFDCRGHLASASPTPRIPSLPEIGFSPVALADCGLNPGMSGAHRQWTQFQERLARYDLDRDFPGIAGTSGLSPHLRFGTLSIRELVLHAWRHPSTAAHTWLKELIWRDFYFQILDHFPHVVSQNFKPLFKPLRWDDWPAGFEAWKAGQTGYPLIDAAMRELSRHGGMHNRLRMVTASFLCKDLGIDWRLGERHFAEQLNDFDLAANNGGWQWAASTGCDAQPWFRLFNPVLQSKKFDPEGQFIRHHLPELAGVPTHHLHAPWRMSPQEQKACRLRIGIDYPLPIIDHEAARQRTLIRYQAVRKPASA